MSSVAAHENVDLDLSGKVAVVAGGTQGIGAATAIRFAQAGASVYIIGRNQKLGEEVLKSLHAAGKSDTQKFEFVSADLSLTSEVKTAASKVVEHTGGNVNYLVETQGGPPNGKFSLTSEGIETHFAVQSVSRFGLAYLLAQAGALKDSIVFVCAPGGKNGAPPAVDDLDLKKAFEQKQYGFIQAAKNEGAVLDAVTNHFPSVFPSITAYHILPGIVSTNAVSNSKLSFPLNLLLGSAIYILGASPKVYADIPVYIAANPKSRNKGLEHSNEKLKDMKPVWIDEKPELVKEIWDGMCKMFGV